MLGIRPDWDDWFLGIAQAVSARADCTRSLVGAVIARDHELIQPGYNGAPPGEPGCLSAGACPRGRHYDTGRIHNAALPSWGVLAPSGTTACGCGLPWPCMAAARPGEGDYADCTAIHAEANAIIRAGRDRCQGATIYVTRKPCDPCMRLILAAGIIRVIWPGMPEYLRAYRQHG